MRNRDIVINWIYIYTHINHIENNIVNIHFYFNVKMLALCEKADTLLSVFLCAFDVISYLIDNTRL